MELTKEQFIETFKTECTKASQSLKTNLLTNNSIEEPTIEVIINQHVSFLAMKMANNDECSTFSFYGKVVLGGFVDYNSIILTEEEFESLYECFEQAELAVRQAIKNKVIADGEVALMEILKH